MKLPRQYIRWRIWCSFLIVDAGIGHPQLCCWKQLISPEFSLLASRLYGTTDNGESRELLLLLFAILSLFTPRHGFIGVATPWTADRTIKSWQRTAIVALMCVSISCAWDWYSMMAFASDCLVLPKVVQATFMSSFPCVFASRLAARSRLRFPPAIPLLLPPRGPPVVFLFFPFLS